MTCLLAQGWSSLECTESDSPTGLSTESGYRAEDRKEAGGCWLHMQGRHRRPCEGPQKTSSAPWPARHGKHSLASWLLAGTVPPRNTLTTANSETIKLCLLLGSMCFTVWCLCKYTSKCKHRDSIPIWEFFTSFRNFHNVLATKRIPVLYFQGRWALSGIRYGFRFLSQPQKKKLHKNGMKRNSLLLYQSSVKTACNKVQCRRFQTKKEKLTMSALGSRGVVSVPRF